MNSRNIKILGGAILAIIAILGAIFIVRPLIISVTASPEVAAAQAQNDSLQKQLQSLNGVKSQAAALTGIRTKLVALFPESANVPDLINLISLGASNAGIAPTNISSFNFSAPVLGTPAPGATGAAAAPVTTPAPGTTAATGSSTTASQYASLNVTLSVKGSSGQFAKFMQTLTSLRRVFSISNFSISGTGNQATLSISGTTYIYRTIPVPGTTTSAPAAGTTTTIPGQ